MAEPLGRIVLLMMEQEQPEGLSARKLVVETAKHNVLTAYTPDQGLTLLERFPKVDAVLVHGLLPDCDGLIASIKAAVPGMPVIVAAPVPAQVFHGADFVVPSHEPSKLLDLLSKEFGASLRN